MSKVTEVVRWDECQRKEGKINCNIEKENPLVTDFEYMLMLLIEECAEVQKAATKMLRFGDEHRDAVTENLHDNVKDLTTEVVDLLIVIDMLQEYETNDNNCSLDFDFEMPYEKARAKREKIKHYLGQQRWTKAHRGI